MAKRILGDDPFAAKNEKSGETKKEKEAPAGDGKAKGTKKAAKGGAKGKAAKPREVEPVEPAIDLAADDGVAADEVLRAEDEQVQAEAGEAAARASEVAAEPWPSIPASGPVSEYGPSIDRRAEAGLGHRVIDALRRLEGEARDRLVPSEEGSARRKPPLEFLWRRWSQLAMRDRSDVVDEFGRDPHVARTFDHVLEFLWSTWFRVEAQGLEHIPEHGRALLVANHSGTLPYDGAMIMYGVRRDHPVHREVRPLVEDFVFHFPYLGTLMNRIGGVRACQENAQRLLERDQLVAVFPEGIKGIGKLYAQRYQLQRFGRGGFIKLALATDSPIVPTAIVGAEEINPMMTRVTFFSRAIGIPYIPVTPTFPWLGPVGLLPLPTKWYIAFGAPLYFNSEYGPDAAKDRILVNKLAEQVRQRIQEMIDALLAERKSVLFG